MIMVKLSLNLDFCLVINQHLEAMFTAMCEGQALHPDSEDEDIHKYNGEECDVEAHEQEHGPFLHFKPTKKDYPI